MVPHAGWPGFRNLIMATEHCPSCGSMRVEGDPHCQVCGHTFAPKRPPVLEVRPTPSEPPAAKPRRTGPILVVAGVILALGGGVAVISQAPDDEGGSPSESTTADGDSGVGSSVTPVESGTWVGDAGADSIALSLDIDGGSASGILRVRQQSGAIGSWYVSGSDDDGTLQLSPGDWIAQPARWSQAGLDVVHYADGSLQGTTSGGKSVDLEQISTGTPDAAAVSADWRNALAMDESTAEQVLQQRRDEGAGARDSLSGYWVPQVASGCQGLNAGQSPLTDASILSTHARLDQEIAAITVAWDDIATSEPENCPGTTMWVSLVPKTFNSADAALRWCHAHSDSCAARYIVRRGVSGTKIVY